MMFPTPLEILMAWLAPLSRRLFAPVLDRLDELEYLIMARADDLVTRLNAATNELASDLRDIRAALQAATEGADAQVAEAVNAVLDRFESPISTLEAMGADQVDPVPAQPVGGQGEDPQPAPEDGAPLADEPGDLDPQDR
jgi:hypothetical protein